MTIRQPRYSKEEHARRGTQLYEQMVRSQVEVGNQGKIVALDVDSGAFEVAGDTLTAAERLLQRVPQAQIWFVRVGHAGVHRFGPASRQPLHHFHRLLCAAGWGWVLEESQNEFVWPPAVEEWPGCS